MANSSLQEIIRAHHTSSPYTSLVFSLGSPGKYKSHYYSPMRPVIYATQNATSPFSRVCYPLRAVQAPLIRLRPIVHHFVPVTHRCISRVVPFPPVGRCLSLYPSCLRHLPSPAWRGWSMIKWHCRRGSKGTERYNSSGRVVRTVYLQNE